MLDTVRQVGIFYKYSPKKQRKLEECISAVSREKNQTGGEVPERRIKKVKMLCDTRWVDRHVALQGIALLHEFLVDSLASISSGNGNWDSKSVTEAHGLLTQLCSSRWIVAFHVNLYF